MTRRISLIISTYVAGIALVALVAYVLIPGSDQIEYLRDWNAYLVLVLFLAFVGLLLGRAKWPQPTQNIFTAILLILLVYGFSGLREPFEFKVLQDEATLSMTALSLHLNRTTEVPTRAHQIGRKFVLSTGFTDKRAAFYPLMVSLVHDITGYRIENAFYLNSLIYLLLLAAIYYVTVMLCSPGKARSALVPGAVISLLAVSSVPIMSRSAAGGGFELLNALFVIVVLLAAIRYVREPGRRNLWILLLATFLLSQLRYESLAFVGFSALVVLVTESRNRQRLPISAILLFSLLLIPAVFQLNIIFSDIKWFEIKEPGLAPFGLATFYKNIGAAVSYMFSTNHELSSNPVFYLTGIFSLIAVMVTLPRQKLFEDRPDYLVFMLWGATIVVQFFIILSYHDGDLTEDYASRYVIPITLLFALSISLFYQFTQYKNSIKYVLVALYLIGIYSFYLPATTYREFNTNYYNHQTAWVNHVVEQRGTFNPLIITKEPWLFILQKRSATRISLINKNVDALAYHFHYKSFEEFYVLQNVVKDPLTARSLYTPETTLDERIKLEEVGRLAVHPFAHAVLSRITAIEKSGSQGQKTVPEKARGQSESTTNQRPYGKKFQLDRGAVKIWHLSLP